MFGDSCRPPRRPPGPGRYGSPSRDSVDSTDPTSPEFSGRGPKPRRRLFEGRGRPGRLREIAHRIGHLVNNGLEIIDAGHTHGAFGKLPQPCLEDGRARRQTVANRKIRRVAGRHHPGPVRLEQQVIVGRDRPELLAIAEAVASIGKEGGPELVEQVFQAGRSSG